MKTIHYDGVAVLTTDEVADAVLALAIAAARYSQYECITVPVEGPSGPERLTLVLGPTIPVCAMTASDAREVELEGSAEAVHIVRERTRRLTELPGIAEGGLEGRVTAIR